VLYESKARKTIAATGAERTVPWVRKSEVRKARRGFEMKSLVAVLGFLASIIAILQFSGYATIYDLTGQRLDNSVDNKTITTLNKTFLPIAQLPIDYSIIAVSDISKFPILTPEQAGKSFNIATRKNCGWFSCQLLVHLVWRHDGTITLVEIDRMSVRSPKWVHLEPQGFVLSVVDDRGDGRIQFTRTDFRSRSRFVKYLYTDMSGIGASIDTVHSFDWSSESKPSMDATFAGGIYAIQIDGCRADKPPGLVFSTKFGREKIMFDLNEYNQCTLLVVRPAN
jgi:hypothetical protein